MFRALVLRLPPDLPAAAYVLLHIPAHSRVLRPDVLSKAGPLHAAHGHDSEPIEAARISLALPDALQRTLPRFRRTIRSRIAPEAHQRSAVHTV